MELNSVVYKALRKHTKSQINLASEASAIMLSDFISSVISEHFHVAKRRVREEAAMNSSQENQLDLFD